MMGTLLLGAEDWICNWVGNKRWVDALQWSQAESFAAAAEERWALGDAVAGSIKEWGPLSFVKMFNSGHMVRARRLYWPRSPVYRDRPALRMQSRGEMNRGEM